MRKRESSRNWQGLRATLCSLAVVGAWIPVSAIASPADSRHDLRVILAVPTAGSTVSGLVRVRGDVVHQAPITQVELLVDGKPTASASGADTFSLSWSAAMANRGPHAVTVRVADKEGRTESVSANVIVRQTFNVRDHGARGNGKADDTQALQRALDAARKAGGGTVYLPRGIYRVTPALTGGLAVGSNTEIRGDGPETVLQVANSAGNYNFIFGQLNASVNLPRVENISFRDFRIDQNPAGNRSADIHEDKNIQNVLQFHHFRNISVQNVRFDPEPGIQAIVLESPKPNTGGATIDGCFFRFVRGRSTLKHKYDHSSVYTEARDVLIRDNQFESDISQCAITSIEVHGGPNIAVTRNRTNGFQIGINVVNASAQHSDVADAKIRVEHNEFLQTTQGIALWSITGRTLRGVEVADNVITMARHLLYKDVWFGIFLYENDQDRGTHGDFDEVSIARNTIRFDNLKSGTITAIGIDLAPIGAVKRVSVQDNTIVASPATGIRLGKPGHTLRDIRIEHNTIIDAGRDATAAKRTRAAILIDQARLEKVRVAGNMIRDTGKLGSPRGWRAIVAHPDKRSRDVALERNTISPPQGLSLDIDRSTVHGSAAGR